MYIPFHPRVYENHRYVYNAMVNRKLPYVSRRYYPYHIDYLAYIHNNAYTLHLFYDNHATNSTKPTYSHSLFFCKGSLCHTENYHNYTKTQPCILCKDSER